jgi:predicted AAA+ superfamily ATPase
MISEIKKVLESQRAELEEKFRTEKILDREGISDAQNFLVHPNLLAVLGVRRCGKSVFSVLLARRMGTFHRVNFDDERLAWLKAKDLEKVVQALVELYGPSDTIILDEPQNIEGWERFASRLRETKRVIVTGSNSRLLAGELATFLTGRHTDFFLSTFSFRELLSFKPNIYLTEDIARVRRELDSYLKGSGFPEYLKFGPTVVRTVYEDVVLKDCIRRYGIRAEGAFRELARYLISNPCSEFTYSKLGRVTGVKDVHTVRNYVQYLQQAFLIFVLERFSPKLKERMLAPKKVYPVDHGLVNFVASKEGEMGKLYESVVCGELMRLVSRTYGLEVCYWRDYRGREVDFVLTRGSRVEQLIQVCYNLSEIGTRERELSSLSQAARELGCSNLLVITEDEEGEERVEGRRIKLMPLWKWLLLAGGEFRNVPEGAEVFKPFAG